MKVSVITPFTLKDEAALKAALPRISRAMAAWCQRTGDRTWEHLLIYDSLSNIKPQYMSALKTEFPSVRPVLMNSKLVGKGHAFQEGFGHASGEICVLYDLAEQIAGEDIVPLLDGVVDKGFECVHAIRHQTGTNFEKQVQNENMMIHKILGKVVSDFGTCCCAVRTNLVKGLELAADDQLFLPAILVKRGVELRSIGEAVARFEGKAKSSFGALLGGFGDMGKARDFQARLKTGCYDVGR